MIARLTADDVVTATGGRLLRGSGETVFTGVSIDTRTIEPGFLFFAIRGPNHDAHAFLADAAAKGAAGLVIEDADALPADVAADVAVLVPDTTRALGRLAAAQRARFDGPVVAITGSNGKTTTKEMCAAILDRTGPCLRTRGNLNNEYGLPLTLLARRAEDRVAVVELGMNHRGEIAALAAIAKPDIGVVTNVGTAHIEHLGSREEIAREKTDLLAALPPGGTAILFGDDPLLRAEGARSPARIVTFGLGEDCDVRAERIERPEPGRFRFEIASAAGRLPVQVAGLHAGTVPNALAAATAARAAGASDDDVVAGLAAYEPAPGRMSLRALRDDVWLIDDSYNANPQSMAAALQGLADVRGTGRLLAILGEMGELGDAAGDAHAEAGRLAGTLGVDRLFAVGGHAGALLEGAREAGLAADRSFCAPDAEDLDALIDRVLSVLRPGDRVLVKGSRAMRMERIAQALASKLGAA
ncbi:MAG: UDP-N-acetylmuramoyl-tripeptide--D-alanyl-D-alanine ligase [Myxococcales bacterium]|nr:UDP-N-acetylmuramoyl-tripeptide--D-alanyl-D-alanine ligase [Myxococcales bacterium]